MQEQIRLYLNEQNYKEDLEHLQEVLADGDSLEDIFMEVVCDAKTDL